MEYLRLTYRLRCSGADAERLAESVLLEQTIETPGVVAQRFPFVRDNMLGRIVSLDSAPDNETRVLMEVPTVNARVDPAQFVNTLFGNASLHEMVSLEDFELPAGLLQRFPGPRFGIEGIRAVTGVEGRPLTCSALKPVGLETHELAALCRTLAEGGIDVVKDDHYLSDQPFSPFEDRVQACLNAAKDVADRTGKHAIYCPNLSGTPDSLRRQADFAQQAGVRAVMVAPMVIGLPTFLELVQSHLSVPVLVHPSFAGATRFDAVALLGGLLRLFGGDAVIFANYGGRFSYAPEVCARIAARLRTSWHHLAAALPVPAGGMTVERTTELVDFFGMDTMLLVGGSLLSAGNDLLDRTLAFTKAVSTTVREALTSNRGIR